MLDRLDRSEIREVYAQCAFERLQGILIAAWYAD